MNPSTGLSLIMRVSKSSYSSPDLIVKEQMGDWNMGCNVQLSTNQPFFRTLEVKLVTILHVSRALLLVLIPPLWNDFTGVGAFVGAIELLVAWWVWSLRIESWGLSMGMAFLHILFPMLGSMSLLGHGLVVSLCLAQMLLLTKIRHEGGYSFVSLASVDTVEVRDATSIQRNMLNLLVIAQILKTLFVFLGGISFLIILGPFEVIPWLELVPLAPSILIMGIIDLAAGVQLYRGVDWGFHLTLVMAPLSVVETLLTLLQPIMLLGIWIAMLVAPCWARDGFYSKLFTRIRKKS